MGWACLYCHYKQQQWSKIIWSNEAYIYLGNNFTRIFITCHADEEYLEDCLVPTFKQSPVHIMVWGYIIQGRKGPLIVLEYPGGKGGAINMIRYCEQVLEGALLDFYKDMTQVHGPIQFQQDSVSCHVSKRTKEWLCDYGVSLLYHPLNSPDLSPIEPVWHELKKIVRALPHPPTSVDELKSTVLTTSDVQGFVTYLKVRYRVQEGKGQGKNFMTLNRPLTLVKGQGFLRGFLGFSFLYHGTLDVVCI